MNNIDLNIRNYNYKELLNLFKLNETDEISENKEKMNIIIKIIHSKHPKLDFFYKQCQKVILTIYKMIENNNIYDKKDIDDYVLKINQLMNIRLVPNLQYGVQ